MLSDGTMVTLGVAAASLVGSWFVLGYRVRELEKKIVALVALDKRVTEIDTRTIASAASQGRRLEKAQTEVDGLRGQFESFEKYAMNRRRKDTAALGHATEGKADE